MADFVDITINNGSGNNQGNNAAGGIGLVNSDGSNKEQRKDDVESNQSAITEDMSDFIKQMNSSFDLIE